VASFVEKQIGYREWARRNARLGDIHSLDDRYDYDGDGDGVACEELPP
jgi:hypothetical protein